MSQKPRVLRSVAVVSSVLLVGCFVVYSLGQMVMMAGSKSNPAFQFVTPKSQPKPTTKPQEQPPEHPKDMSGTQPTFTVGTNVKQPNKGKPAAPTTP